jgi:hypothetical protein
MSETENNSTFIQPKFSKLSIISFMLGILGIFIVFMRIACYRPWWSEFVARNVAVLLGICGLITGFIAIRRISKRTAAIVFFIIILFFLFQILINFIISPYGHSFFSACLPYIHYLSIACLLSFFIIPFKRKWRFSTKGKIRGGAFAHFGIAIGLLLSGIWMIETCGPIQYASGMGCGRNLKQIGNAIAIYSQNNEGQYPDPNKWCDLLVKNNLVDWKTFYCNDVKSRWKRQAIPWPIPKNQRSYFAMNSYCKPNSPPDTVLLFETEGGWNLAGGHELLSTKIHRFGELNVLLQNGEVEIIYKPEQFKNLKWE